MVSRYGHSALPSTVPTSRTARSLARSISQVGLGTDVSGGSSPSILTAIQHASICSKVVAFQKEHGHEHKHEHTHGHKHGHAEGGFAQNQLSIATLLYLATLGGAELCSLSARVGSLESGKAFDALVVSVRADAGNPGICGADGDGGPGKDEEDALRGLFERFLFCGDDRNVRRVYVQGKLIGGKEFRN